MSIFQLLWPDLTSTEEAGICEVLTRKANIAVYEGLEIVNTSIEKVWKSYTPFFDELGVG